MGFLIGRCREWLKCHKVTSQKSCAMSVININSLTQGLRGHRLKTTTWKEDCVLLRMIEGNRFLTASKIRTVLTRRIWRHITVCAVSLVVAGYHLTHWGWDEMNNISQTTFQTNVFNENVWISIKISLTFVPKGPINNIPALVQMMAWRRSGDKRLSEPMMVSLPTHICVTRPQWIKTYCDNWGRIQMRVWTYKRHPIPRPNGRAMGCLLWKFLRNGNDFTLTTISPLAATQVVDVTTSSVADDEASLVYICQHHQLRISTKIDNFVFNQQS